MNKDEAREQRIEIATRLMEAWLSGPDATNPVYSLEEKAAQFANAADTIVQAVIFGTE